MRAFFVLLGAILGFALSRGGEAGRVVACVLGTLILGFFSYKKGRIAYFASSLGIFFIIGLLAFWLPVGEGYGNVSGMVVKSSENYLIVQSWFKRYYVSSPSHSYEVGDVVSINGKCGQFKTTTYESRFDFASYLHDLGVREELSNAKIQSLFQTPFRIRSLEKRFLSSFDMEARALLDSLLFGHKDYSSSLIVAADEMNVLFVLSSSGLFYSFTLRMVEKSASHFSKKYGPLIALGFGSIFLPFSYAKVGVIRVFLMRLLSLLDKHKLKKDIPYLERLSFSLLLIAAFDVFALIQVGFLAGFGISLFTYFGSRYWQRKNKVAERLLGLIAIRVFLLPLNLSSSGKLHLFGVAFSLLLMPLGYGTMTLGWISFFTFPFDALIHPIAKAIVSMVSGLSKIDLTIPLPIPSFIVITIFYVLIAFVLYLSEIGFKFQRNVIVIGALSLYCLSLAPIVPLLTQSVSFINVGQGDCALLQDGLTTVLIDTGGVVGADLAEESLIPYLRKRRIYHIDCVIASHQDYDHVGALTSLQANFNVKRYVKDKKEFPLRIGNFDFHNHNAYPASEENDKSLVLSFAFMDKKWIFTGDAPIWVEKRIVDDYPSLDCDILKVGHHGSDTSTCPEFLDLITPSEAVISCGAKNKYGHPKDSVLSLLEKRKIKVRRTDLEGTITYAALRH